MASFVTEVLAHSGSLEKEDLGTRISRLTRRVEEIKVRAAHGRLPLGRSGCGADRETRAGGSEVWGLLGERPQSDWRPRPGTVRRKGRGCSVVGSGAKLGKSEPVMKTEETCGAGGATGNPDVHIGQDSHPICLFYPLLHLWMNVIILGKSRHSHRIFF